MGETHEKENKDYLAKKIAEEIGKIVIKTQRYGHELWYPYSLKVTEPPGPYQEPGKYIVCTPFELDILGDLGAPASEVNVVWTTCDFTIAWGPNRPVDSEGNPLWFPKTIPAGGTLSLEDKKIEVLYIHVLDIHRLDEGTILINVQGSTDC